LLRFFVAKEWGTQRSWLVVTGSRGEKDQIGRGVGEWAFGYGGIDGNALSDAWV